jgi:hypothetical protein
VARSYVPEPQTAATSAPRTRKSSREMIRELAVRGPSRLSGLSGRHQNFDLVACRVKQALEASFDCFRERYFARHDPLSREAT